MATVYLLGTGASLSDPERTATMLAVKNDNSMIIVDSGGDTMQRLQSSGLTFDDLAKIEAFIITHEHADHVSGFPMFLQKLWLTGRTKALPVYGIKPAIDQLKALVDAMASFKTEAFATMFDLEWHEVPFEAHAIFLNNDNWHITGSPGIHGVPVMGLRFVDKQDGGVLGYSCDTEKSDVIRELVQDADLLVHEATGDFATHCSAQQAAEVARDANIKGKLLLVHLPPKEILDNKQMEEAKAIFLKISKGKECGSYYF